MLATWSVPKGSGVAPVAGVKVATVVVSDDQPGQILGGNFTRTLIRAFPLTLGQVNNSANNLKPGVPSPTNYVTNNIVVYPNAFCDGPVCEPARAGIFTGSLDYHHTVHTNQDDEYFNEQTDFAVSLFNAGWITALFGKRFVNFPLNYGLNGNGPGKDGSNNPIAHIPYGYTYGLINVDEPVNPYQYVMINGPLSGFTPQQAWAGIVANPGCVSIIAYDFNNTANFTAAQIGAVLTVTGWVGPVVAATLNATYIAGDGAIAPGMTITVPGQSNITILSQLTSTDPNNQFYGNGTYTVDVSQTYGATAGAVGTQTNGSKNVGHNSSFTLSGHLAWLNTNKTAILAGTKAYAYVAPFSPHDPPIAQPQDQAFFNTPFNNLDALPSFNVTGTNGPTFYASQAAFSGSTSPTLTALLAKPNNAEQAVLCIDRYLTGTVANSGTDGLQATLNGWGILSNTVMMYTTDQGVNYGQWKWETKRTMHDSTMRVPFLAYWGSNGPSGGISNQMVSHVDIMPTLSALTGVAQAAPQVDGTSILAGTRTAANWRWVGGDAGGAYNNPPSGDGGSSTGFDGLSAATAGYFRTEPFSAITGTCTISIANPAVITYANNFQAQQAVSFSTTGVLPTGITAGQTYWVITAGLTSSSFRISATQAGSALATSGIQSGTQSITDFGTARAPTAFTEEGLYNFSTCSTFTGSIAAGTLASGIVTGDALVVGHVINGTGVTPGNYITANLGGGTFSMFYSDTTISEAMTASDQYQMNNVQASGSYSATKASMITQLNALMPNFLCVNDPSYVAATSNSGNLTLTEPVRATDGMLLFALIEYRGTPAFTAPAGWTALDAVANSNATNAVSNSSNGSCGMLWVYQIRSGAPNLTFTRTAGNIAQGWLYAYNVSGRVVSLLDHQTNQATVNNSTTISVPGFTASVANQAIFVFGANSRNSSVFKVNSTLPAISSGDTSTLTVSRNDIYSAPQTNHWTQKDTLQATDGTLFVRGIIADGMLASAGQVSGAISFTCGIGALPSIMAATFSSV